MRAMRYLLGKRIKNGLLEIIRKPSRLILAIVVIAYFAFILFSNLFERDTMLIHAYDLSILGSIVLALMLLLVGMGVVQGFAKGSTIFAMSDVNFAFVSPLKSTTVLGFSMLYQAGKILLWSMIFISYSIMLNQYFDVNTATTFVLIGCGAGSLVLSQILSMGIYILTCGRPKRKVALAILIGAVLAAAAAYVLYQVLGTGQQPTLTLFWKALDSAPVEWIPFAGWLKGVFMAVVHENTTNLILYLALLLLSIVGIFLLISKSRPDYYEDVLQTTEKMYLRREAVKAGKSFDTNNNANMGIGTVSEKIPKVKGTGLGRGAGASALFFKQIRELGRSSRFLFVDKTTVSVLLSALFMTFIMKIAVGDEDGEMTPDLMMALSAGISAYLLLIFNAMGQWTQELTKPYIFLIPESPFKKLIWSAGTTILKPVLDGILIFTILGYTVGASPVATICCIGLYISFGYFYTGGNIMSQRIFGQAANKGFTLLLYMLLISVVMAPGLAVGIIAMIVLENTAIPMALLGAVPVIAWNLITGTLLIFLFRNILNNMENSTM